MGVVTTIQRFSLNDGPGIRSTVFFKGCNLRCAWCHNPETLLAQGQLHLYPEKCTGCGACLAACPNGARRLGEDGIEQLSALCTGCGACAAVCFSGALSLSGTEMSVEEILNEVLQDRAYYERSGGGVTISGGEVFAQPEFARALLAALKAEGVSTAVETNFCFPFSLIEGFLPLVDLFMIDLKLMDEPAHKRWTGLSNRLVLENIALLDQTGKPFIIRTPLIPGVNDDPAQIVRMAEFLAAFAHLEYYELLNFNPLGASKYKSLGIENPFEQARPLGENALRALSGAAQAHLTKIRLG
ncbi:MAG: glycyl-radical enzyme activating protein [Christensenellaceae bacterium]|nr:glycyl-radical enzyme activating protein [Christensenellaceae bacterium]